MAGHSQFKNIMFRKGKQDKERSKLFSKLGREITVASKAGLPDPKLNARLRGAITEARQQNMTKDAIERAIKKGQGGDAENYDEIRYEGYGPGGTAIIVEAGEEFMALFRGDAFVGAHVQRQFQHGVLAALGQRIGDHADMVEHEGDRIGLAQSPLEVTRFRVTFSKTGISTRLFALCTMALA